MVSFQYVCNRICKSSFTPETIEKEFSWSVTVSIFPGFKVVVHFHAHFVKYENQNLGTYILYHLSLFKQPFYIQSPRVQNSKEEIP